MRQYAKCRGHHQTNVETWQPSAILDLLYAFGPTTKAILIDFIVVQNLVVINAVVLIKCKFLYFAKI